MKKPKITVIIPAYNSEKYIARCLDSILAQSYQDFEILIIDDGSKDKTGKIINEYSKKYSKIKYIKQKNMGVAKTRNKAIKLANAEYVAFIDNDDFIDKDYLEKLLPKGNEDVVISGYKRPDVNGEIIKTVKLNSKNKWSRFIVAAPWAKIYRKKFIIDNKLSFLDNSIGEDVYFNLIAMMVAKKVKIIDYCGYNWFMNRASVSNKKQKNFNDVDVFKLLNSSYNELQKRDIIKKNYEILEYFFYRYIIWFLLYSVKKQTQANINKIYDELFDWLSKRFPDYKNNKMLAKKLPGEIKSTKAACQIFNLSNKLGLGKRLINVWSKV